MDFKIVLLRLTIIFVLSFIFGIERQKSHKPVGFGTFIFVAIGSCALAIIAMDLQGAISLLGAIVTGIGFLGAGALIKTTDKIFGFTTAASIWLFAILGLVIGIGDYKTGGVIYIFIWICIFIDKQFEEGKLVMYQKKLELKIHPINRDKELINLFEKYRIKKYKLISKKTDKKEKSVTINYLITGWGDDIRNLMNDLENIPCFMEFSLE